jgi:predicted nucleic acid-binding protein
MRGVRVFLDSNVLLYGKDRQSGPKTGVANHWLRSCVYLGAACTNLQVLNEVTHVMLRKREDLAVEEIFAAIDELSFLGRSPISEPIVARARQLRIGTNYSWWDCLLLASALELNCTHFLSEDLQDGQAVDGLTIVDPFAHTPEHILST